MLTRWIPVLLLLAGFVGCTKTPDKPAPSGTETKLPAEVVGDPASALPKKKK